MSRMTDAELVKAIDDHENDCSTWEANFIASLQEWLKEHKWLTEKQRAKAEEILEQLDSRS